MPMANVGITFECVDEADAQAKIATWTLHPGCQVFTSITAGSSDAITDEGGGVVERIYLNELDPPSVVQGVGSVTLRCLGSGFTDTAKIVLDGTELPTAYRGSGELTTTIDASTGGHAPGTFDVLVRQEEQETGTLSFTIETA